MLSTLDLSIVVLYALALFGLAQWVSREKPGHEKDASDYFLAGKSLPWWAIGASLIAANISAEQIIGMSGSGYAIGLAIASYEWMAAITLILVGKFLLPVFLKTGIYTMPQFLEQRFDHLTKWHLQRTHCSRLRWKLYSLVQKGTSLLGKRLFSDRVLIAPSPQTMLGERCQSRSEILFCPLPPTETSPTLFGGGGEKECS